MPSIVGMDELADTFRPEPRHWIDDLEQAEAEIKSGLAMDGSAMRQRLKDSIARLEATAAPGSDLTTLP